MTCSEKPCKPSVSSSVIRCLFVLERVTRQCIMYQCPWSRTDWTDIHNLFKQKLQFAFTRWVDFTWMLLARIWRWWTLKIGHLKESWISKKLRHAFFSKNLPGLHKKIFGQSDTKVTQESVTVPYWGKSPHAGTGKFLSNISIMRGWWPLEAASYPKSESHWVRKPQFIDSSVLPPS